MDLNRDDGSMNFTEPTSAISEVPEVARTDPEEHGAHETPEMDVCGTADRSEFEAIEKDGQNIRREDDKELPMSVLDKRKLEDENGRYERNLKKFMENGKAFLEARSRGGKRASERLIKSDGVVTEKVDYTGNVSKISSILSKVKLERSSAPATCESACTENPGTGNIHATDGAGGQSAASRLSPADIKTPVSSGTRRFQTATTTPVTEFKLPITPPTRSTPTTTGPSILIHSSPGSSKISAGQSTPLLQRPTVFNFKPRKAFYMFSPESPGILRQCQSLPNINRSQRKEEKHYQRRSFILDERSRIVRSLFKDEPGLATPETRLSMVPKSHIPKPSIAKDSPDLVPMPNTKSKICRKLNFARPQEIAKVHSTGEAEAPTSKEENPELGSPGKRKEISPPSDECPPGSSKKVRISPEPQISDSSEETVSMHEEESNATGAIFDALQERREKGKDEGSSTSKEN